MATGQVALTRHRPPMHIPKSRPAVPAFLQKLHEMVNDPNNQELIRWSEAGDSFFVLDHERFAREVLGRWFKHQNFASFVRQLNMYGFHKIPHLQQGVLRSDTDTEFWNFGHPNFHRGRPELLCLIQRKKQAVQAGDEPVIDLRESSQTLPQAAGVAPGQVMDLQAIMNGLATIQRHQSSITTELNELKRSNELLWQEAMDARQKHQKQQDTINRIVKFLAGVFGNRANPHKEGDVGSIPSSAVIPRRTSRLLIEDGRGRKAVVEDEHDVPDKNLHHSLVSESYPIVETPLSAASPAPSETFSVMSNFPIVNETPSSIAGSSLLASSSVDAAATDPVNISSQVPKAVTGPQSSKTLETIDRPFTPGRSISPDAESDHHIQALLNQLSPNQLSQLLSSLSNIFEPLPTDGHDPPAPTSSQITQYTPPLSELFSQFSSQTSSVPVETLLSMDGDDNLNSLSKTWKSIEDIQADVDNSNAEIDQFIRSLGLDPDEAMPTSNIAPTVTPPSSAPPSSLNINAGESTASENAPGPSSRPSPGPLFDLFLDRAALGEPLESLNADISPSQTQQSQSFSTHPPTVSALLQDGTFPFQQPNPGTKRKPESSDVPMPVVGSELPLTLTPSPPSATATRGSKRRKK